MSAAVHRPVAIVTGGSRGIGAAVARAFARSGYAVAVNCATDTASAEAVAGGIRDAGGEAAVVRADLSGEAGVLSLFEAVDRIYGPPDALVNNAGGVGSLGRVEQVTEETLQSVFAVNAFGPFLCCREAVRRMSTAKGGRGGAIVNVSSRAAGLGGSGEWVHYAASKAAVEALTVGLAREVAGEGIRVNAVQPGLIATDLHASVGAPDRLARLGPTVPMQRPGTPEEVAEAILWLASPASGYVTGALLPVSGGR